jgi:hypothetical protein
MLLCAVLLVQWLDLRFDRISADRPRDVWYVAAWPTLSPLAAGRSHVALVPPGFDGSGVECEDDHHFGKDFIAAAMYFAYTERMTTNSAYLARVSVRGVKAMCADSERALAARRFRDDTLYVFHAGLTSQVAGFSELSCRPLESHHACIVRR